MKKILYLILGIFSLLIATVLVLLTLFFVDPTMVINPPNIKWALNHSRVLESWSWKSFTIHHDYLQWNKRHLSGELRDFCFRYSAPGKIANSCFEEISWDFDLFYEKGFHTKTYKPFRIHSPQLEVSLAETNEPKAKSEPPDIHRWWKLFWSGVVPDTEIKLDSIVFHSGVKTENFNLHISKTENNLYAQVKDIKLFADPKGFTVTSPPVLLPEKLKDIGPFYFRELKLEGKVKESGIPLVFTGTLEEATFDIRSIIELPLRNDFSSLEFRRDYLSSIQGELRLPDFRKMVSRRAPAAFRELPAPFNVMDGSIVVNFAGEKRKKEEVHLSSNTHIDLSSEKENLDLTIAAETDLPIRSLRPETVEIGLDFKHVRIELPKLSKKSPPPQFMPDRRFKKGPYVPAEEKNPVTDVLLHLTALNRKALHIRTNLLDEPLRLNFDLLIGNGKINRGHVTALPLKTKIFKRPIHLKTMTVTFKAPLEPVITSVIEFPLPEYKITLTLEGPVSKPRYSFRSEPPLPQNDIYAVLLFGRPLADLNPDDKTAAQKTNQILSQGILSLSVLYFLSGSPVEYVGFDPDSKNATAQFGLSRKTSLRVGGGEEGMNAGGLRHSLGRGWYIDTSVQNRQNQPTDDKKNYGVILERVIAY